MITDKPFYTQSFSGRVNHPHFTPFNQKHTISPKVQRERLFSFLDQSRKERRFNERVIMRGGRVLPALNP